jgi:hypothetical protein
MITLSKDRYKKKYWSKIFNHKKIKNKINSNQNNMDKSSIKSQLKENN